MAGLGACNLATAALIILFLPRSKCDDGGGWEEGPCLTTRLLGIPDNLKRLETEADVGQLGSHPQTSPTKADGKRRGLRSWAKAGASKSYSKPLPGCKKDLWVLCSLGGRQKNPGSDAALQSQKCLER